MAGNSKNIKHGPGWLYFAPVGFVETPITGPSVDLSTIPALVSVGYTDEGSTFSATPSFEDIEVAEEIDPVDVVANGREMTVGFACAEVTAENIAKAFNGGTVTTATGTVTFEPPSSDTAAVHTAVVWQSFEKDEIWIYRDCVQTGAVTMERRKGATKTTIPQEFRILKPAVGKPFKALLKVPAV